MKDQYVDIPPELMGKADPDQQWIEQQLDRIDPWRHEQGHDGADTAALRKLVLQLRQQRDQLLAVVSVARRTAKLVTDQSGHELIAVEPQIWQAIQSACQPQPTVQHLAADETKGGEE